jgi:hypothetical protein
VIRLLVYNRFKIQSFIYIFLDNSGWLGRPMYIWVYPLYYAGRMIFLKHIHFWVRRSGVRKDSIQDCGSWLILVTSLDPWRLELVLILSWWSWSSLVFTLVRNMWLRRICRRHVGRAVSWVGGYELNAISQNLVWLFASRWVG